MSLSTVCYGHIICKMKGYHLCTVVYMVIQQLLVVIRDVPIWNFGDILIITIIVNQNLISV